MRKRTAFGPERALLCLLFWVGAGCGSEPDAPSLDPETADEPVCERDELEGPDSADALSADAATSGFLCPLEDEDWYGFEVDAEAPIVNVHLKMSNARSPVEPTYAIWADLGGGEVGAVASGPESGTAGAVDGSHLLEPGAYFVAVRDQNDDAQDLRNTYALEVDFAADPDSHEPNASLEEASPLPSDQDATGFIASSGDLDYYAIEVPAGSVIRITLDMPMGGIQPVLSLLDPEGNVIVFVSNAAGSVSDTALELSRVLALGGTYYVRVGDEGDDDGDATTPYTLRVEVIQDQDPNEPNDHPDEATPLMGSVVSCGAAWSDWIELPGTIGSPGDNDWFLLPLSGCVGGVLEAEVSLGDDLPASAAWTLQQRVQASVALVRSHDDSACADDESCRSLTITCDPDPLVDVSWDCAGYFDTCLSDGLCAGASVCLPEGSCGANQTQRHYTSTSIPASTATAPQNLARLSAPILLDGNYFLRVSDFQSDAGDPAALYTLRVRVRTDPDPQDARSNPNGPYANTLMNDDIPLGLGEEQAETITVQADCATGTWTSGALSYENDLDFFKYAHPCPDSDCTLQIHYESDAGEVEPGMFIHQGGGLFSSFPLGAGTSGNYGGIGGAANQCFFAYSQHGAYTILIRDQAEDGRQWSSDQGYRFCIEKVSDACEAPCVNDPVGGCHAP